jgi:hypothetical protein
MPKGYRERKVAVVASLKMTLSADGEEQRRVGGLGAAAPHEGLAELGGTNKLGRHNLTAH